MFAFTDQASRASCSTTARFTPSRHSRTCTGTPAASSWPRSELDSVPSVHTTGANRCRSTCVTSDTRLRVFPLSPRPSTTWRTVLGEPVLIPAKQVDEAPQVEALIRVPSAMPLPQVFDVAEIEAVQLARL